MLRLERSFDMIVEEVRDVGAQTLSKAERMLAARRTLLRAEAAAGLQTRLAPVVAADDDGGGPGDLSRPPGDGGAGSAVVETGDGAAPAARPVTGLVGGTSADHLPVPAALAPLLPAGGLRRGTVIEVGGATSLLLAMAAAAAQDGGWTALAALPDAGLEAAAEAGLVLGRSVVVPRPGPEAATVVGALVDGFDVLAVGPVPAMSDRDRRLLSARLRSRGTVLLSAGPWPGSDVVLRATGLRPSGVGHGWGSLQDQEMTVHVRSRSGAGGQVQVRVGGSGLVGSDVLAAHGDADGPAAGTSADTAASHAVAATADTRRQGLRAVS